MKIPKFCVLFFLTIFLSVFPFCSSPAFAEKKLEKEELTIGFIKLTDMAPLAIAKEKGFFEEEGLSVTLQAQGSTIVVQDSGPGVPDYALPKLGQKFFSTVRPDGVTKGSGLGLAIVQQIMALHGGSMHVENTHPGLRVELRFP